jgi:tRNA (Thr-GGU) A37 N-methylase
LIAPRATYWSPGLATDRPNPIGLHRVRIVTTEGLRILVRPLEALDQTPIVDVKPVLGEVAER